MNSQIIYCERTEKGATNIPAIQTAIMTFPIGKRLEVVVRLKSNRSVRQNKYFHGCCHIIAKELGYTTEEMKEIIKFKFLKREKVIEQTGEVLEYIEHTSKLNKEDFGELMDNLIKYAAESFSISLPIPDEQLKAF